MNSLATLTDAIVGLVLIGILIGIWSLYNIWIGCEEDRLEELLEEEHSIPPKTVRDLYNRYVVLCVERGMHACSYLQYLKDWIAISEEDE